MSIAAERLYFGASITDLKKIRWVLLPEVKEIPLLSSIEMNLHFIVYLLNYSRVGWFMGLAEDAELNKIADERL